ncbi:MAG: 2,3-diaminopropionate biosynthesis protein SbnA [Acidobacteria bacterium]|nr:2,3-diaminopropionate biosynthesis protein SbnA [Acidobacteriota bacterium]
MQSQQVRESVLSAIGNTPLVRLSHFLADSSLQVFAKLELLNPGGSIKDRTAVAILEEAFRSGAIDSRSVIVESSSGNMGIGLAQACRYHGLRFICVVDPKTAAQNIQILRTYDAEIVQVTEPDPETGEFLQARIDRVKTLLGQIESSFWPNQYENLSNPGAHFETTMREIASALDGKIDYLFVATSTCGTIRGCAEHVRHYGLRTKIVAVDAVGSQIFSNVRAKRMIPGLGAGIKPPLCRPSLIDECVHVDDVDCVAGCRRLVLREAILAGGSSGGVVAALEKMQSRIPPGSVCVVVLPDRGERYLDTVYSDEWVHRHFGNVEYRWHAAGADLPVEAAAL